MRRGMPAPSPRVEAGLPGTPARSGLVAGLSPPPQTDLDPSASVGARADRHSPAGLLAFQKSQSTEYAMAAPCGAIERGEGAAAIVERTQHNSPTLPSR